MDGSHYRCTVPALVREHCGVLGNIEHGNFERRLPDDGQLGSAAIHDAANQHALLAGFDAERIRKFAFAFNHDDGTLLDALNPLRGGTRRHNPYDEQIGRPARGFRQADGR